MIQERNQQKPLRLIVDNLASPDAPVIVGVYNALRKFPSETDQLVILTFIPEGLELCVDITELGYDTYAIALYQDLNRNGKCDRNFLGVPTEPFAFSNNFKPKLRAPTFEECCFNYNDSENEVRISMLRYAK